MLDGKDFTQNKTPEQDIQNRSSLPTNVNMIDITLKDEVKKADAVDYLKAMEFDDKNQQASDDKKPHQGLSIQIDSEENRDKK